MKRHLRGWTFALAMAAAASACAAGVIPPNATLVFEIELLEVRGG